MGTMYDDMVRITDIRASEPFDAIYPSGYSKAELIVKYVAPVPVGGITPEIEERFRGIIQRQLDTIMAPLVSSTAEKRLELYGETPWEMRRRAVERTHELFEQGVIDGDLHDQYILALQQMPVDMVSRAHHRLILGR